MDAPDTDKMNQCDALAAWIAVILFAAMSVVQLLVAGGLLPIDILWGGSQNTLTLQLRLVGVLAAALLLGMAYIVYARRYCHPQQRTVCILSWCVAGYMGLNAAGNFASSSDVERFVFGPGTVILAVCCTIVSLVAVPTRRHEKWGRVQHHSMRKCADAETGAQGNQYYATHKHWNILLS